MSARDAAPLRSILAAAGIVASVEARGALALVIPGDSAVHLSDDARQFVVEAARTCGFSHVAIDVTAMTGPVA